MKDMSQSLNEPRLFTALPMQSPPLKLFWQQNKFLYCSWKICLHVLAGLSMDMQGLVSIVSSNAYSSLAARMAIRNCNYYALHCIDTGLKTTANSNVMCKLEMGFHSDIWGIEVFSTSDKGFTFAFERYRTSGLKYCFAPRKHVSLVKPWDQITVLGQIHIFERSIAVLS